MAAEKQVLDWVNAVVSIYGHRFGEKQLCVSNYLGRITNLSENLQNGAILGLIVHHYFPGSLNMDAISYDAEGRLCCAVIML